jgi:hypothetical protein
VVVGRERWPHRRDGEASRADEAKRRLQQLTPEAQLMHHFANQIRLECMDFD